LIRTLERSSRVPSRQPTRAVLRVLHLLRPSRGRPCRLRDPFASCGGSKKLDFDDKKSILQKNMSMMGQLRGALRFDPRDKKFLWYFNQKEKLKASDHVGQQNKTIDEADLRKFYKSDKASKGVISSMERILACGLNQVAILILIHVVVFDGDGLDLNNGVFVEQVQINYFNLLYRYFLSQYEKNYARKMLSRTISLLADLRGTCEANNETEANIETENT